MAMELRNRGYRFDFNGTNGRKSFHEHNEQMKSFRQSHGDTAMANSPGYSKLGVFEYTRVIKPEDMVIDTGGARLSMDIDDWFTLVAALQVEWRKAWQN